MLNQIFHPSLDVGAHTPFMLLILIALEAVLSADNAIALAAIAQGLHDRKLENSALNIGLLLAYVLRIVLILTATWVIQFWQFELFGALYLLWLVLSYFHAQGEVQPKDRQFQFSSLWQVIPMIAFTDLAFSLDSVTTAIAVSNQIWLIIAGGTIGVITLRFLAGLFIRWIEEYTYLEDAGFITVGFVGLRLLLKVAQPQLMPPEWLMIIFIVGMFIWGFSKKNIPNPVEEINSQD
jgi:YkoY family integral membrane protein